MPESLEKRRRRHAEIRSADGDPIDVRKLAGQKFLTDPVANAATLAKSVMSGSETEDRRAYLRERNRTVAKLVREALASMDFPMQKYAARDDKLGKAVRELQRQLDLLEHGPSR